MSGPTGGPFAWWGRVGPAKRVITALVVLVLGANLVLAALDSVIGSDPGGPAGSSYATGDDGVAAWSDLLIARGVDVRPLREPVAEADLPAGGTVVLSDPSDAPTSEAVQALAAHVADGGRVVTVGAGGAAWAGALLGTDLGWHDEGDDRPAAVGPLLAGLDDLRSAGEGSFRTAPTGEGGPATVEAGPDAAPVAIAVDGLVAVADPTLLDNAHLAEGDDAALAVVLAGPGPVAFAEAEHGYGAARGLGALPFGWRAVVVGLGIATLVGSWSVGQRLGPPEATDRPLAPARRAYVDAVAAGLPRGTRADPTSPTTPSTSGGDP